jgi:hypothetical protein
MICPLFQIFLPTIVGGMCLMLATTGAREENFPVIKSDEPNFSVTRSDGTVGHMRPPDQKEVGKLVGYIRDGMKRADRSNRQEQLGSRKFLRIRK